MSQDELPAIREEAVARRVAELLLEQLQRPFGRYVETAAVARHLCVSIDWVREHAAELGAVRVGDGPTGALRFDLRAVEAALERRRLRQTPAVAREPRRTGRRRTLGDVELLPLPSEGQR